MADDRHIVRTKELDWAAAWRGRHPFNPASEMVVAPLSDPTGMTRLGAKLIRIPPGKDGFIPHAHSVEEEFIFVLEGEGVVVLDGVAHAVGAGDFVGLPTDGVVHALIAKGPGDLVYLTAGERSHVEVTDMPSIGKTTLFRKRIVTLFGETGIETLTEAEWMARAKID